jgi:hypothetical protein
VRRWDAAAFAGIVVTWFRAGYPLTVPHGHVALVALCGSDDHGRGDD